MYKLIMPHFNPNELLFTTGDNKIMGGGFQINSSMLREGISPMSTINSNNKVGGKVSDIFHNLAVPSFLYMKPDNRGGRSKEENNKDEMLSEDIHEHFLELMKTPISKKSNNAHTRKKTSAGKKHTRKNL